MWNKIENFIYKALFLDVAEHCITKTGEQITAHKLKQQEKKRKEKEAQAEVKTATRLVSMRTIDRLRGKEIEDLFSNDDNKQKDVEFEHKICLELNTKAQQWNDDNFSPPTHAFIDISTFQDLKIISSNRHYDIYGEMPTSRSIHFALSTGSIRIEPVPMPHRFVMVGTKDTYSDYEMKEFCNRTVPQRPRKKPAK